MDIPTKFKVGVKEYVVQMHAHIEHHRSILGRAYLDQGIIVLATKDSDGAMRESEGYLGINETFWHEIVHTILYDMGSKLNNDEAFVNAMAERLNRVIETAEFDRG